MATSYIHLAFEALESPLGIAVPCSDPLRLRAALYRERQGIPALAELEFRLSPVDPYKELWIIRKGKPNGSA